MPQSSSAYGIPDRTSYGDTSKLSPGQLVGFIDQLHDAIRAKRHHDIRIGSPELGLLSWVARKGLPGPGEKHLAVRQPLHSYDYGSFEGEIPKGQYGAGTVKKQEQGQALITKVTPESVHFTLAHRGSPQRMALIKPKGQDDKNWLLINTTPTKPLSEFPKSKYKTVPASKAEDLLKSLQPGASVQAKVDGAHNLAVLGKEKMELMSPRTSKATGHPITYTEKFFGGRSPLKIPKELEGSVLSGEIYGTRKGKSIPPQELGGILNATIANALQKKRERGVDLRNLLFDVRQFGKTPVSVGTPYSERMKMLEQILPHLPADQFHLPEQATNPEEALKLWRSVVGGKHPLTREGVVIHPQTGKPSKIKQTAEHDVVIKGFSPGKGKYTGKGIGAFTYADPSALHKILGEVGTGLSDELRKGMFIDPESYLGRTARVKAQERYPSGALRAPALISLHEDISAK